jgi:hypothetical protein
MSRSGYSYECDNLALYRGNVERELRSKRGQAFLNELAVQMDAMPEKVLIAHELINQSGGCCTMGVVCKARKLDVSKIEYEDPESVARSLGINHMMAAEIAYWRSRLQAGCTIGVSCMDLLDGFNNDNR